MPFDLNTIQYQVSTSHDSCRKQLEECKQQLDQLNKAINKLMEQKVTGHICGKGHLITDCFQFPSTSSQHAPQNNQNFNFRTNFRNFRCRTQRSHPYSRKFYKRNNKSWQFQKENTHDSSQPLLNSKQNIPNYDFCNDSEFSNELQNSQNFSSSLLINI